MNDQKVDQLAHILWDYMQFHETPVKSDAIFCLCSHDTRVGEYAADLMLQGLGDLLIFSGGVGVLTQDIFSEPEADLFAKIAIARGVPEEKIIIENKSTNTGQNVEFTHALLQEKGIDIDSFLLVQKPYMERRTFATFKKQWPDPTTKIFVTSPKMSFEEYTSGNISKEFIINVMVGDLQRIKEYPALGFQIPQAIPGNVWAAYEALVDAGFTKHVIVK